MSRRLNWTFIIVWGGYAVFLIVALYFCFH